MKKGLIGLLLALGLISVSLNAFAEDYPCDGRVSGIHCGNSQYRVSSTEYCNKENSWLIVVNLDCKKSDYDDGGYFGSVLNFV